MKKQTIGFILLCVILTTTVIYSIVLTKKYQSVKMQNRTSFSDTEMQNKIDSLTDELVIAKSELQAIERNNENEVISAAETFLSTYYDNNNYSKLEQLKKIKRYVSKDVYALLQPTIADGEENDYTQGLSYKTWISDMKSYYKFIDSNTADVLIYCILNVQTDGADSATPFIFSAKMQYENEQWIVTDIQQKSTVRINYY
ncbi:MAG: hypothetical protein K2H01_01160 [Ruminococcus sp.]|nr:hypothetical protein [Ruminococcus sp.]